MSGSFVYNNYGSSTGLQVGDNNHMIVAPVDRAGRVGELTSDLVRIIDQQLASGAPAIEHEALRADVRALAAAAKTHADDPDGGTKLAAMAPDFLSRVRRCCDNHVGVASCLSALIALWPAASALANTVHL